MAGRFRVSPRARWKTIAHICTTTRPIAAATGVFVQHHRHVPDAAIRRLYALRHDPESPYIRAQADEALGAILSLETGMEDE